MKKSIFFSIVLLVMQYSYSQTKTVITEDFDGSTITFTVTPQNSWTPNTTYTLPGSSSSNPKSYLGHVPLQTGGTAALVSAPAYDFSTNMYSNVQLQFSHICKISPCDKAKIEYKYQGSNIWHSLELSSYRGASTRYDTNGFNAASYPEWAAADSLKMPQQSWWKEETFDLSPDLGFQIAEIRFVITKGAVQGTQISYGWLLENVRVTAATYSITPPTVNFVAPYPNGTVFSTGPWTINALVQSATSAPIVNPYLNYTATVPGILQPVTGSLLMSSNGNSLWQATIPQYPAGTEVMYSVTGIDADGNQSTATAGYVITVAPPAAYVTIGTANTTDYFTPINTNNEYSWSRQIYLASELSDAMSGGTITHLAWEYNSSSGLSRANQKCYFKAVDATTAVTGYVDALADGATLVWQGTYATPGGTVWGEIELDQAFVLPANKNLMVYWTNQSGAWGSSLVFNHTQTPDNKTVHQADYSSFPGTGQGTLTNMRPNARFYIIGNDVPNSAGLNAINMPDTLTTSSTTLRPIIATLRNRGSLALDSIEISYKLNNLAAVSKTVHFSPALPWEFNHIDTLDYYIPKVNDYDTIVVMIGMPNGVLDEVLTDDTLTKIIYGSADILAQFVGAPADTVNETKAQEIKARIRTLSGTAIAVVSLNVTYTIGGTPTNTVLPMVFDVSDNLWKATIPSQIFGTDVAYSITLTDILGNIVSISKGYNVAKLCMAGSFAGIVTDSLGVSIQGMMPFNIVGYTYTQQIYPKTEINESGIISAIAFDVLTDFAVPQQIDIYMGHTTQATFAATPGANIPHGNLQLVYSGVYAFNTPGWNTIQLQSPFLYDESLGHLVVAVDKNSAPGTYGAPQFKGETTNTNRSIRYQSNTDNINPNAIATLYPTTGNRSNIQLVFDAGGRCDPNSVAMVSINSPTQAVIAGTSTPIQVSIRNKGVNNLTSCVLQWSLNGVIMPPTTYSRNLPSDFSDTITIGSYIPTPDKRDTVMVWVSLPNTAADPTLSDDTLKVYPLGCQFVLSGNYPIGNGGAYANLSDALSSIQNCGVAGDVTLQLKGTHTNNISLKDISTYMNGYSLTITSFDNHPDSATIQVASGAALLLNNSNNIEIGRASCRERV